MDHLTHVRLAWLLAEIGPTSRKSGWPGQVGLEVGIRGPGDGGPRVQGQPATVVWTEQFDVERVPSVLSTPCCVLLGERRE